MHGVVTDIQRFSLNDGPGIRTTVFLKGCNMNCAWCHNPETIAGRKEIHYYAHNCIRCFKCVVACLCKAHKKIGGEHHYYPKLCVKCGKCAAVCYAEAMAVSGRSMSVDDMLAEILQDKAYYDASGGGVTLSGGEALCQLPVALELAAACRERGVGVAAETNLSLPWEEMLPLIERLDLVMCDLKLIDNAAHARWTGLDNERILENLRLLDQSGKPYLVRTPLVPGATDDDANIDGIARFLSGLGNLRYYELLNFNPLGGSKYTSLSRHNPFEAARPLPAARLDELRGIAERHGLAVRVA